MFATRPSAASPPTNEPNRSRRQRRRALRNWYADTTASSPNEHSDSASMHYKTATVRHEDEGTHTSFYVSAYGCAARLGADGMNDADAAHTRRVYIHFANERSTERLDVLAEPDLVASYEDAASFASFVVIDVNAPWSYHEALVSKRSEHPATAVRRHCDETLFRAVVLRRLRRPHAPRHERIHYYVYAALSPLHERSVDELTALANARFKSADPNIWPCSFTRDEVRASLAWLAERQLTRALPYRALPAGTRDYNHGLSLRIREIMSRPFALSPGANIADGRFFDTNRAHVRRTINNYRQARTVELISEHCQRFAAALAQSPTPHTAHPRIHDVTAGRVLIEQEIVLDTLRVHCIGTECARVASLKKRRDADADDAPLTHLTPPRFVAHIIAACSDMPPVSLTPTKQRCCNPWGLYAGNDLVETLACEWRAKAGSAVVR